MQSDKKLHSMYLKRGSQCFQWLGPWTCPTMLQENGRRFRAEQQLHTMTETRALTCRCIAHTLMGLAPPDVGNAELGLGGRLPGERSFPQTLTADSLRLCGLIGTTMRQAQFRKLQIQEAQTHAATREREVSSPPHNDDKATERNRTQTSKSGTSSGRSHRCDPCRAQITPQIHSFDCPTCQKKPICAGCNSQHKDCQACESEILYAEMCRQCEDPYDSDNSSKFVFPQA